MKKTLFLTLALLLSVVTFAQNHAYLNESFDGDSLPEGWTLSEVGNDIWKISASSNAGGTPNELSLANYPPIFNQTTRVITHAVDLSGIDEAVLSFKHCINNMIDGEVQQVPYVLGIATSTDKENWNVAWSEEYKTSGITNFEIFEFISTPDFGKDKVYFSLFFTGSNYMLNGWVFDDIAIFTQDKLDMEIVSLNTPEMSNYGEHEISFTVQNLGITAITSFEARFETDDNVITETFKTNIETLEVKEFTFSQVAYLTPGSHKLKVELTSVNGENDGNKDNNIKERGIEIGMGYASKTPMIEHFSSSTCSYCVEPNQIIKQVLADNPGKYTYTKYPTKFPGLGDPYTTDEVKQRVNYYQVSGAPEFYLNGFWKQYEIVSPEDINNSFGSPTFADVRGAFIVEGNTITVTADFMSYIKMDSVRAYISINEKTTTENTRPASEGGNGETEFHHIMMKLNDVEGQVLNLKAGEPQRVEFTYDMSKTNMEEINDLEVALWLQNYNTHEIYNSRYALEYAEHCYPAQNMEAEVESSFNMKWEAPEKGTPAAYNIYLDGELLAENQKETSYESNEASLIAKLTDGKTHIAAVEAVYENGNTSVRVAKIIDGTFVDVIENQESIYNIYPNPAKDYVMISGENIKSVYIFNSIGAMIEKIEVNDSNVIINTRDYSNGVYFFNILDNKGNSSVKKIVVTQ